MRNSVIFINCQGLLYWKKIAAYGNFYNFQTSRHDFFYKRATHLSHNFTAWDCFCCLVKEIFAWNLAVKHFCMRQHNLKYCSVWLQLYVLFLSNVSRNGVFIVFTKRMACVNTTNRPLTLHTKSLFSYIAFNESSIYTEIRNIFNFLCLFWTDSWESYYEISVIIQSKKT